MRNLVAIEGRVASSPSFGTQAEKPGIYSRRASEFLFFPFGTYALYRRQRVLSVEVTVRPRLEANLRVGAAGAGVGGSGARRGRQGRAL